MKRGRGRGKADPNAAEGEPKKKVPKEKPVKLTFNQQVEAEQVKMDALKGLHENDDVENFLRKHLGDSDSISELHKLLASSEIPRPRINSLISIVFELLESNPGALQWGKQAIQAITAETLAPSKRIKDAFFFPSDESERKLVVYLNKAKKSMLVCVFTITNNCLADAIRNAVKRGVDVRVISDDECMKMLGSDIWNFHNEGIPVRVDLDPHAHMHHKFVVIDDYLLLTGSFNWTKQAVNKNQENLSVIDDPELCKLYTDEFNRLWVQFEESVKVYMSGGPPINPALAAAKAKKEKAALEAKETKEIKPDGTEVVTTEVKETVEVVKEEKKEDGEHKEEKKEEKKKRGRKPKAAVEVKEAAEKHEKTEENSGEEVKKEKKKRGRKPKNPDAPPKEPKVPGARGRPKKKKRDSEDEFEDSESEENNEMPELESDSAHEEEPEEESDEEEFLEEVKMVTQQIKAEVKHGKPPKQEKAEEKESEEEEEEEEEEDA